MLGVKNASVVRGGHPRVCGDGFLECGGWKKPPLYKHAWGLGMRYCLEDGTAPSLLCKYLNLDKHSGTGKSEGSRIASFLLNFIII